jgi:large subunit ribosomal protein L29
MKAVELRDKSVDELRDELLKLSQQIFKYRMELATGQLDNPGALRAAKRDLARVKTIIREKSKS